MRLERQQDLCPEGDTASGYGFEGNADVLFYSKLKFERSS